MSDASRASQPAIACPVHKIALPDTTDIVYGEHLIKTAICPQCSVSYSNDPFVLVHPVPAEGGRPVKWSAFSTKINTGKKKPPMYIVHPTFHNLPITVIRQSLRAARGDHIIKGIDVVTLRQNCSVSIQGFFNLQSKKFYAFPSEFTLGRITERPLYLLDLQDPDNLLGKAKKTRAFLQALQTDKDAHLRKVEREEKHRKAVLESAFPGQFYSVLLQREAAGDRCPYCGRAFSGKKIIKCVAYRDLTAHHCVYVQVAFCHHCNLPVCLPDQAKKIRSQITPDIIKVLYADTFQTPSTALAACREKVVRLEHRKPTLPTPKPLPHGPKSWSSHLPYLSALPESRSILVYAKKCGCENCKRKYGQDTIADRKALVRTASGNPVEIHVQFCMGCGQYYMNLKSYYAYRKLYGDLMIQIQFDDAVSCEENTWQHFAQDSVLSRNGYSVRAGISQTSRQHILSNILEEGLATKHEVIALLTQFIQLQKNVLPEACSRWREDLLFVNQYKIGQEKSVGSLSLKQGARIRKTQEE